MILINFKSYSCNWTPGKGLNPYVKREKFSEFENILKEILNGSFSRSK